MASGREDTQAALIKQKLATMSKFLNPEDDGPDSDGEDDFDFDEVPSRTSSRNSDSSASTKASDNTTVSSGTGSSLLESLKGFKYTGSKVEEDNDASADAEFGIERSKTPEPTKAKQEQPTVKKIAIPQGLGDKIGGKYAAPKKEQKEPGKLKVENDSAVANLFAKPRTAPTETTKSPVSEDKPIVRSKLPSDLLGALNKQEAVIETPMPEEKQQAAETPTLEDKSPEDKSKYLQKRGSMNFTEPTIEKDTPKEKADKQEAVEGLLYLVEATGNQLSENSGFEKPFATIISELETAKKNPPDDKTMADLTNKTSTLLTTAIINEAEQNKSADNTKTNDSTKPSAHEKMDFFQQVLAGLSMVVRKIAELFSTKRPKASGKLEHMADKVDQVNGFVKKLDDKFKSGV